MRVTVPLGTRPEIIKLGPVIAALTDRGHDVRVVATGQHPDFAMSGSFLRTFAITPAVTWTLPAGVGDRVGALVGNAIDELSGHPADAVLCLGDTWTVPAFALAAGVARTPLIHLEAGLRSFNEVSLEERNRLVAASLASLHLAPTTLAAQFLRRVGVGPERIRVVGNPVIDAMIHLGVCRRPLAERSGILLTAHRATNVDDPIRLTRIVDLALALQEEGHVTFPAHPRTADRLQAAGLMQVLINGGVAVTDPLPYREFLDALASSRLVVTDSGGVQEEAAWLGVGAVVMRSSTPRWEGVKAGLAILAGDDPALALAAAQSLLGDERLRWLAAQPCPYGDGTTGLQVADLLDDADVLAQLRLSEPRTVLTGPR